MTAIRAVTLVNAGALVLMISYAVGLAQLQPEPTVSILDEYIRTLAGKDATDCGRVSVRGDVKPATDCAMAAFRNRKAFFVRYSLQGIDSEVAVGVALTASGKAFGADFDSMGWNTDGLPKDYVLSAGNHIVTYPCPKPVLFRVTPSGRLSCFPPKKKSTGNIMSPTFEPY